MALSDLRYTPGQVPDGYHAVPVSADQMQSALRVCVLVKAAPDASGALVLLRTHVDARVYLGCIVDASGYLHDWAEVWVQTTDALVDAIPAYRETLTNANLDQRWTAQVRAYERFERPVLIRTGAETSRPLVTFIDLKPAGGGGKPTPFHPADAGSAWVLCEDDGALAGAGLPAYSTTLHRYLYVEGKGKESAFVPVWKGSPRNARTKGIEELVGGKSVVALNAGGGLMMVRRAGTLTLPAYMEMISGQQDSGKGGGAAPGVRHGRATVSTGFNAARGGPSLGAAEDSLFLGQQGKWGRLIEAFHLKVRAVADAIAATRALVETSQRPLLNVSPESFHVFVSDVARGLPHAWSARVSIVDPGEAIALPMRSSEAQYFVTPAASAMSVFRPAGVGTSTRGSATLRIRQVLSATAESMVIEGTFSTDQRINANASDLVWVRVTLTGAGGASTLDLYGRLEADAALAAGEWRFRTVEGGQRFSAADAALIQTAAGVPLTGCAFEVIPLVATPADLHSLGVIATKVLLTDAKTSLPVVLDEVLSLARQVAKEHDASVGLPERIGGIFGRDARWVEALGPHRLHADVTVAKEAFDLVPATLWWETLAAIVRMFPGIGPDSECEGLGDAPFGGMHLVFERAAADFDRVLRQTRSLIVIDWNYNREVHSLVRQYAAGLGGSGARSG